MDLARFLKLINQHLLIILCSGVLCASIVFLFTKDERKEYTSRTVINTGVVSGYNIENHNSDSRVDRDFTRNELENLVNLAAAYETMEMLSLRLIAHYVQLDSLDPQWISPEGMVLLRELFQGGLDKSILLRTSIDSTVSHLIDLKNVQRDPALMELVYSDHEFFGIEQLQKIRVSKKGTSDLLEFTYTTSDPHVCRQTLVLLTEVFFEKHRSLKEGQSEDVLGFFEEATNQSKNNLRLAEDKLLNFRVDNNIINYYEQTRFIADKKEDLDEMLLKERMQLEGALSSQKKIESQLNNRNLIIELNNALLDKRDELSNVSRNLALLELPGPTTSNNPEAESIWRNKAETLENEINEIALQSQAIHFTPEGLKSNELLSNWLQSVILVETSRSRLEALDKRKIEFESIYAQFAPWGSRLKKIEREIALAEEAYLENLHSFNQARLHLQNTIMSSNLRVMDAPFLPIKDNGSKRVLLIIVAFMGGILSTLGIIILLEFLDTSMKIPSDVSSMLNLSIIGTLPRFPDTKKGFINQPKLNFLSIRKQAIELIYQKLLIRKRNDSNDPYIIMVSSSRGKEGVSFFSNLLKRRFESDINKVMHLAPADLNEEYAQDQMNTSIHYRPDALLGSHRTLFNWIDTLAESEWQSSYHVVIIEVPSLLNTSFPFYLFNQADEFILMCRSNRSWSKADNNVLDLVQQALKRDPLMLLNGVRMEHIDEFLGDLPKPRSKMRRMIKQMASFNFTLKEKI